MKTTSLLHYTTFPLINQSGLIFFTAFGIPADILLNSFQIFAVPYLMYQAPEHIRQELHNEVATFYVMGAVFAGIEAKAGRTRTVFISRLEKSLRKFDPLIIDEFSYLTFNRSQSELLLQVIYERSERASVIITTNLEFSQWTQLFENEMMVAALVDRVTFNSRILNMNCTCTPSCRMETALMVSRRAAHSPIPSVASLLQSWGYMRFNFGFILTQVAHFFVSKWLTFFLTNAPFSDILVQTLCSYLQFHVVCAKLLLSFT